MAVRTTKRKTTRKATASKARKTTAKRKTSARKTTARKTTARKTTAKRAPARKSTARKTSAKAKRAPARKAAAKNRKVTAIRSPYSKSQIVSSISESTGLAKNEVKEVIEQFAFLVEGHVKKGGAGEFTLPGLLKIKVVSKPAKPARRGINPFTGEEQMFKAKPAHKVVKVKPLKGLKDMVA